MKLGVEGGDAAFELGHGIQMAGDEIDLDGDLGLQLGEVDVTTVQRPGLAGRSLQTVDEGVDDGTAVRVVAAGVAGDEAHQRRAARREHGVGIEPGAQERERQAGAQIRQHRLERGCGPAQEIEQAPLAGGDEVLQAAALFGQALQGMALGRRDVDRIEARAAEGGHGGEQMGIGEVGLGVLAEVSA